jgi:uncharacterized membrane protein YkvA (DUF1232 family)
MAAESTEKRFVRRMRELLVLLPYDMKVLFEAMSDGNLPPPARQLAAGAAIYCLSPADPIPDPTGLLAFVDDVVVVRLSLERLLAVSGSDAADYPVRFSDQFSTLAQDLELIRGFLGEAMAWLESRLEKTLRGKYKGKDPASYVEDAEATEFLYEEGLSFTTDYDVDDESASRLQSAKAVLESYRRRMSEESRRIG